MSHHPPFAYEPPASGGAPGGHYSGSPAMLAEVDAICAAEGAYPHAWLSAHSHKYQRFTRSLAIGGTPHQVPFVVCGNGGHGIVPLVQGTRDQPAVEPQNGADVGYLDADDAPSVVASGLKLEKHDDQGYGYLRVAADAARLRIAYHKAGGRSMTQSRFDLVTVDLRSRQIVAN